MSEKNYKKRLDLFLVEVQENKYPRAKIALALDEGLFLVNGKKQKSSYKLKQNDVISFSEDEIENLM